MVKPLLVRGLACGLLGGVLAGAFAFVFGEPLVDEAIRFEERLAEAADEHAEAEAVSRGGQRVGLFFATGLYGLAVGGLFGLTFAALRGRVRVRGEGRLAILLAGVLLVAVVLVPFVKYPANPPAVGSPDTITERTLLFYVMIAASLLSLLAAWRVARRLDHDFPGSVRALAAALVFGGGVAVAFLLLPGVDEVPDGFPSDALADFRRVSLGVHLVLWSSLGLLFALTVRRLPGVAGASPFDARTHG